MPPYKIIDAGWYISIETLAVQFIEFSHGFFQRYFSFVSFLLYPSNLWIFSIQWQLMRVFMSHIPHRFRRMLLCFFEFFPRLVYIYI